MSTFGRELIQSLREDLALENGRNAAACPARRSRFTLRLPPDLEARLDARLKTLTDRVSKNQWVIAAIREKLDRDAAGAAND